MFSPLIVLVIDEALEARKDSIIGILTVTFFDLDIYKGIIITGYNSNSIFCCSDAFVNYHQLHNISVLSDCSLSIDSITNFNTFKTVSFLFSVVTWPLP
jgi:hypothetical protein